MKHCIRFLLLFIPSLVALGLLGVAFVTNWWIIPLEKNIPQANPFNRSSDDTRLHSTLLHVPVARGPLGECMSYRLANVLVSNSYDFRDDSYHRNHQRLSRENCSDSQFTCRSGSTIRSALTRCIDRRQQCDRLIDCEDKSDEVSCPELSTKVDCPADLTECPDGNSCYRKEEETCDGVSQCIDDSDERDCDAEKCRANKRVFCPREKKCARRNKSESCDGIVDCEDNSDEENCQKCRGDAGVFLCDSKCFLAKHRCDNTVQCSDLRDESNCNEYSTKSARPGQIFHNDRLCVEQRLNPLEVSPTIVESSFSEAYPHSKFRTDHLHILHYCQLIFFYGISAGLLSIFFSIVSLLFITCCRHKYRGVPIYLYGLWIFLSCFFICAALASFLVIWLWRKQIVANDEQSSPFVVMIHQLNPSLRHIEFFGLSFWLACGAALSTLFGLFISYGICCVMSSSRADDKEYEIMHMQNY